MSVFSRAIPNFWNGISQQSAATRREGQAEIQDNGYGTIVDGLRIRPATNYVAELTGLGINNVGAAMWHFRTNNEDYLIIGGDNPSEPIFVYRVSDGYKLTVSYSYQYVLDYLTYDYANTPAFNRLRGVAVGDMFILANTSIVTAENIVSPSPLSGTVQLFANLPTSPAVGDVYKIQGDNSTRFSSYYVRWDGSVWRETFNPEDGQRSPNQSTMPMYLTISGATATITPGPWATKQAGDIITNPSPSFISTRINGIFFFRGRFGILTQSNIVLSQIGDYWNFYATSVIDVLDDDPIDVSVSPDSVDNLRWAIPFEKSLLVSGLKSQFSVGSGDSPVLSTKTISSTPTTRFEIQPQSMPFAAGPNIYFIAQGTHYLGVREYFVSPGSLQTDAADITSAVPRYIPEGECIITGINVDDVLFFRSSSAPYTLFVYKYFWIGDEKVQSAWSTWTFDRDIAAMAVVNKRLYMVMKQDTTFYLEYIDMEYPIDNIGVHLHLDKKRQVTTTWNGEYTTWNVPTSFFTDTSKVFLVRLSDGKVLHPSEISWGSQPIVYENLSGHGDWVIGQTYRMLYELSPFYLLDDKGLPMLHARVQLQSLRLEFKNSGFFKVAVEAQGRDTREDGVTEYASNVETVSSWDTITLLSGAADFPIFLNAREAKVTIIAETFLPVNIVAGSWKISVNERARLV